MMITSTANRFVKWVRALQGSRRDRWKERRFVLEGTRLATEVVLADLSPDLVLHTDHLTAKGRGLVNQLSRLGAETRAVSEKVMEACSDTQSPPGILVVAPFPDLPIPETMTLTLVVDGLADPGNLGTILRTALAAGVETVFLTEGCVDPFNPKVVRAAAGALLRLPIYIISSQEGLGQLEGMETWLAAMSEGMAYHQVDWRMPSALIIGGEAHGVGGDLRSGVRGRVHIPLHSEVESLNAAVAAGIILFEIARQREET